MSNSEEKINTENTNAKETADDEKSVKIRLAYDKKRHMYNVCTALVAAVAVALWLMGTAMENKTLVFASFLILVVGEIALYVGAQVLYLGKCPFCGKWLHAKRTIHQRNEKNCSLCGAQYRN